MTWSPRFAALCVGPLLVAAAHAADIPKPPLQEANRIKNQVYQMRSGTIRVAGDTTSSQDAARNRQALKTVAEWLAFSVAAPPYNGEPVPRDDKYPPPPNATMALLMQDAESFSVREGYTMAPGTGSKVSQEQIEYAGEFGKAIAAATKVVLDGSAKPIERINTVRLMSIVARIPAPDLADPLVAIVNNPRASDAEKLYAFEGLRNLLDQSDQTFPDRHIPELHRNPDKLAAIGQALTNYITAKRPVRDDKDRAVIEFVRRHAIEAMARFKDGVLRKPNKDLIYRPSWTLARVMENDPSVSPPFTVPEMTEAAIGFCLMKPDPDMNLDVAAPTIHRVLVYFGRAANLDGERARRDGTLVAYPWKVYAARLSHALAAWRDATKALPADRNPQAVATLASTGVPMLSILEKDGAKDANTGNEISAILNWGQNNPPKAWAQNPPQPAILYRDDPNSRLPFAAAAAPTLKTPAPAGDAKKEPEKKAADPKKTAPPKK